MEKSKKLIIVGSGEFAEIAYEYFSYDSPYEVIGFAVEKEFKKENELMGRPVIEFESIQEIYSPKEYETFVAISYIKLNRVRTRLFQECKNKGYHCASFISPHSFVWHNVQVGENVFIFENNTIQYNVKIGDNVILWSGNHVGHRTIIEDNCWLTSHDVISGFCKIGKNSFLGVNATLGDQVHLARDTVFGAGAMTVRSLEEPGGVYVGCPARKLDKTAYMQFNVRE